MSTTLTAPAAAVVEPVRRRRPLRLLLVFALLVGVAYVVVQARHEPLQESGGTFGVADDQLRLLPQQTVENAFGTDYRVVAPAGGTRIGTAFNLTNTGRTDVEVLDVGNPLGSCCTLDATAFRAVGDPGSGRVEPLSPFTLAAGETRLVGFTVQVPDCPPGKTVRNAGALVLRTVPVTWRWAGRTHVTDVELSFRGSLEQAGSCRA